MRSISLVHLWRHLLGLALCALPFLAVAAMFRHAEDLSDGMEAGQVWEAFWFCQLLVFASIAFVFPLRPIRRFQATVAICAFYLVTGTVLRVDGFLGDRVPQLVWRWSKTGVADSESLAEPPIDLRINQTDYPAFRGWNMSGVVTHSTLHPSWTDRQPQPVWSRSVGFGWSSFALAGGICVTQEQRGSSECIVAYRLTSGAPIWIHRDQARFDDTMGGGGPRATPAIAAGRVIALGATGLLTCLDATSGGLHWQVRVIAAGETIPVRYGFSASPLVVQNRIYVAVGGRGRTLVAYNLADGKKLWSQGDFPASYSSPQLWRRGHRHSSGAYQPAILLFHGHGLSSFDPATGRIWWTHEWITNPPELNNVCQPVVLPSTKPAELKPAELKPAERFVFISSGYSEGCALLRIRQQPTYQVEELWWNQHLKAKFSSVVLHDQHIYGLDNRKLVCLNVRTGEERWRGGRFGYGQLMLVGNQLVIMAESGLVSLVDANPNSYTPRGRFRALQGRTWNHPALSGNWLVVRNDRQASCWRLPVGSTIE